MRPAWQKAGQVTESMMPGFDFILRATRSYCRVSSRDLSQCDLDQKLHPLPRSLPGIQGGEGKSRDPGSWAGCELSVLPHRSLPKPQAGIPQASLERGWQPGPGLLWCCILVATRWQWCLPASWERHSQLLAGSCWKESGQGMPSTSSVRGASTGARVLQSGLGSWFSCNLTWSCPPAFSSLKCSISPAEKEMLN